ncbi:hypothetical protein [Nitrospirillum iridis]|uniref:Uncharacterized protein n=1 Tax=Nitrospirillum iridis TaxID=765888 RepID=A0A7X0AZJ9_9PROT|nr:hypothetical protein [Nitrospirillum iridis]MBB6251454.1 hypothetical protein [Nitrospirillum iridis]
MDYGDAVSQQLMTEMLSVRRLDAGSLSALLSRIRSRLLAAYGPGKGGFMAAMLMARVNQAVERPEDFPALLSDAELLAAYGISEKMAKSFGRGGFVFAGATGGPPVAREVAQRMTWSLPRWLENVGKAMSSEAILPVAMGIGTISWIISSGHDHFADRKQTYKEEMIRRNMAIP